MNEKILSNKKNGMGMLLLFCLLYLIAIAGCVLSAIALEHEFSAPPVIAISWIEGAETTGSSGSYTFWKLYRYTERSRILFCQSILYQCKPCFQDKVESEWRC